MTIYCNGETYVLTSGTIYAEGQVYHIHEGS